MLLGRWRSGDDRSRQRTPAQLQMLQSHDPSIIEDLLKLDLGIRVVVCGNQRLATPRRLSADRQANVSSGNRLSRVHASVRSPEVIDTLTRRSRVDPVRSCSLLPTISDLSPAAA
jgi:hypothetical protein